MRFVNWRRNCEICWKGYKIEKREAFARAASARKDAAMSTEDTLMPSLQRSLKAGRPLDLLSTFRGVPVRYKASIRRIQAGIITVQAPSPEAVCLDLEREVVMLGEGAEEAMRADVASIQLAEGVAQLSHLRYADSRLGNRLMVRVEPKVAMSVRLEVAGQVMIGQLIDVSMGGLAVHIPLSDSALILKSRVPVRLAFELPAGPIELMGIVRSVKSVADGKRLGLAFPQDAQVSAIVGYVLQRRVEILAELKVVYEVRVKGG